MALSDLFSKLKGGAGSGNFGHAGRKGKKGGSASSGSGGGSIQTKVGEVKVGDSVRVLLAGVVNTGGKVEKIGDNMIHFRNSYTKKLSKAKPEDIMEIKKG